MTLPEWFRLMWRIYAAIMSAFLLLALVALTLFAIFAGIVHLIDRPKLPPAARTVQFR